MRASKMLEEAVVRDVLVLADDVNACANLETFGMRHERDVEWWSVTADAIEEEGASVFASGSGFVPVTIKHREAKLARALAGAARERTLSHVQPYSVETPLFRSRLSRLLQREMDEGPWIATPRRIPISRGRSIELYLRGMSEDDTSTHFATFSKLSHAVAWRAFWVTGSIRYTATKRNKERTYAPILGELNLRPKYRPNMPGRTEIGAIVGWTCVSDHADVTSYVLNTAEVADMYPGEVVVGRRIGGRQWERLR